MPIDSDKVTLIQHGDKTAVRFVTSGGVTAVIATDAHPDLMRDLKRKLERKLRRRGITLPGST
jgi:hypothetical protein